MIARKPPDECKPLQLGIAALLGDKNSFLGLRLVLVSRCSLPWEVRQRSLPVTQAFGSSVCEELAAVATLSRSATVTVHGSRWPEPPISNCGDHGRY